MIKRPKEKPKGQTITLLHSPKDVKYNNAIALREYIEEKSDLTKWIEENARDQTITLLYGAKDQKFNNALALKEYLEGEKGR